MPNQTIILIHGGASSGRAYKDVIPILEEKAFTCITPDLPGHGSAAAAGPFTFEAARRTVAEAVQQAKASSTKLPDIMLAGISLGGQTVLSFLQHDVEALNFVKSAIVSGASIGPPDDRANWELPHMPQEQEWMDLLMKDAHIAGMENMPALQATSLGFTFDLPHAKELPPVLAVIGEHDTAMSRRDLAELTEKLRKGNAACDSLVMKGAWHNHNIDVPAQFAEVVIDWAQRQTS